MEAISTCVRCRNEVKQGMPDFALLDTNGDGVLTSADDMYTPYYPGKFVHLSTLRCRLLCFRLSAVF